MAEQFVGSFTLVRKKEESQVLIKGSILLAFVKKETKKVDT